MYSRCSTWRRDAAGASTVFSQADTSHQLTDRPSAAKVRPATSVDRATFWGLYPQACLAAIVHVVATVLTHPHVQHPRVEPSEYIALQADAGWSLPIEYIDGQSVTMPPIGDTGSAVQGALFFALRAWQEHAQDEGILRQDVFVAFPGSEHLAPDISWWRAGRRSAVVQGEVTVIPDLVVEVLSPSTRANDVGPKRDVYLRSGVKELWLADPDTRMLTRVRPNADDEPLTGERALTTDLLDGFSLPLTQAF
jgi:Uma2 family endonuclease